MLVIIEAATVGLTTIWFAIGAFIAFILSLIGFPLPIQIAVFVAVSIVLLIFTRPICVDKLNIGTEKTNTEALIGRIAVVEKEIHPMQVGQVSLNGLMWSAVCPENLLIVKGTHVKIKEIQGVKLVVSPVRR